MTAHAEVRAGRRRISVSHPDKVMFPAAGVTKLDLARHYAAVAEIMVPHVRDRPLALQSYPRGVQEGGFFLKHAPDHFPDWIRRAAVPKREGGVVQHAVVHDPATLVYLAGQNVVTPHVWTSRADRLERPDRLVLDIDPPDGRFDEVRATARAIGDLMRRIGLTPFAMTTGSRGLHVVAPLRRTEEFGAVHALGAAIAEAIAAAAPDALTTAFRTAARGDRIYLDAGRNAYGQHAVAPYGVRARPDAPVAAPLRWEELDDPGLRPDGWTVRTIGDRLRDAGDPWAGIARCARAPGPAARALARVRTPHEHGSRGG